MNTPNSIMQSLRPTALSPKDASGSLAPKASSSISSSFEKMGLGKVGGLGGRMGELEKASLRLAQFKAMKTAEEQEKEIAAQKEMQEKRLRADSLSSFMSSL